MLPAWGSQDSLSKYLCFKVGVLPGSAEKFMWALLVTREGLTCCFWAGSGLWTTEVINQCWLTCTAWQCCSPRWKPNLLFALFRHGQWNFNSLLLRKVNLMCWLLPLFVTPSRIDLYLCVLLADMKVVFPVTSLEINGKSSSAQAT